MQKFKTPNRSFSTRLSLWFTGCSAAILLMVMGVSLYFVYNKIKSDTISISRHAVETYVNEISSTFKVAEVAALNMTPAVVQYIETPDSLTTLLKPILDYNDYLYGAGVAVDPSYHVVNGRSIAPYLCRTDKKGEYSYRTLHSFLTEDWYKEAKEKNVRHWTKPFYGKVGEKQMIDYQIPLHDVDGHFIGVFMVDITLEWLGTMIDSQKIYETSFIQILDGDGNEVISRGNPLPEKSSYTFTAPIENVGWTMFINSQEKDVMRPVRVLRDILLLLFVLGLTGMLFMTRLLVGKLAKPVIRFARAADEISNGNFNTELPEVKTEDELMLLRDSLDEMQHELAMFISDLRESTENQTRIENELQIANKIQLSMLPKSFPSYIFGTMVPAREVGGDLFDFLRKGDNLYFIVGDVSGKGVPASLLMAVTSKVFRNVAYHVDHPGRIVSSINHSLSENNSQSIFVTLLVGMLNMKTGLLTYCNAGHNPPILISSGRVSFVETETNIPAGVINLFSYEEQKVQLQRNDRIILYTDGVTEAKDMREEFYAEDRLLQASTNSQNMTPEDQVNYILKDVQRFSQNTFQNDDITIFAIEFKE